MIFYSLNSLENRKSNLDRIIPIILNQCDKIFVNMIGYTDIPKILINDKIHLNFLEKGGSETRFNPYNEIPLDSYFFTIDDDIIYPNNYSEVMIQKMKEYNNKCIICVHGSDIDLNQTSGFYKKNRKVFHFTEELKENRVVMIPGVGTSCFYKESFILELSNMKTPNMSDPYIGYFAKKQKMDIISIKRKKMWLEPLNGFGTSIFGNNPHKEIDEILNKLK